VVIDAAAAALAGELLEEGQRPLAIVERTEDGSLILAEQPRVGQRLAWAMRSPSAARADMRRCVARLAEAAPDPVAALLFSCIGRGPCFHDGEDCEVNCLRERFPGLPLIGCYGTGQIAPSPMAGNRLLQNAVVTALISPLSRRIDVQSQP
jgi:small ligand-binding sensory domain FIST